AYERVERKGKLITGIFIGIVKEMKLINQKLTQIP
ncbi:hypothetical protein CCACVL1_03509, partial [Corchorus capsularis]